MSYEIHGHAVMDLILASGRTFDRASLINYIEQHFGAETRFCTCSAFGMSATELVEFLSERRKFTGPENSFTVDPEQVCRH